MRYFGLIVFSLSRYSRANTNEQGDIQALCDNLAASSRCNLSILNLFISENNSEANSAMQIIFLL